MLKETRWEKVSWLIYLEFLTSLEGKDSTIPIPPSRLSRSDEAMRWDFREGILPPGIEVIGGEPEFQLQRDGSTALYLPPMCFLKVILTTI
jgi:hypothetical protein